MTLWASQDGQNWSNLGVLLDKDSSSATIGAPDTPMKYKLLVMGGSKSGGSNTVEFIPPSGPIDDLAYERTGGLVKLTFSKPVRATRVKLKFSQDAGVTWADYPAQLDENSTSYSFGINLGNTFDWKLQLVVEGGNREGESNIVTFIYHP
ncbi:hypothetical protein [Brevibacillus reuszeri]|uniref:hypothetical protein n=1 Tax=Brevibacillus reuszeri TaxID=54915 RepID=UPI0028995969|nr:hypothetical protein [Brevibacillus reuszeri]